MTPERRGGLLVERDDGVVTLTIDRPERRNALDVATFAALRDTLREIAGSRADRVVLLTGAGGAFSSGGDLTPPAAPAPEVASEPSPDRTLAVLRSPIGEAALALHELPQPSIALVEGVAAGAGANLAFGCDLVLAAPDARFAELFVRRGLSIDFGGTWLLPRLIGLQRAKALALLGDWIDADDALRLGLVTEVVANAELRARGDEWARRLAARSATALTHIKRNLDASFGSSMTEALEREAQSQAACTASDEFAALLLAFRDGARS
jgi:2-(1,2-epoxy-1,2-dihydrophenyl)acetyl-CoA isomerase